MTEKIDVSEMTERSRYLIREFVANRLDVHRRKNDNDMDAVETAKLRGRIAECVNLLNELDRPGNISRQNPLMSGGQI